WQTGTNQESRGTHAAAESFPGPCLFPAKPRSHCVRLSFPSSACVGPRTESASLARWPPPPFPPFVLGGRGKEERERNKTSSDALIIRMAVSKNFSSTYDCGETAAHLVFPVAQENR